MQAGPTCPGRYAIVAKQGTQTHLTWKLEAPKELGQVQKDLSISQEGSLVLSIKVLSHAHYNTYHDSVWYNQSNAGVLEASTREGLS